MKSLITRYDKIRYKTDKLKLLDRHYDEQTLIQRYQAMFSDHLASSTLLCKEILPELTEMVESVVAFIVPEYTVNAFVMNIPEIQAFSFSGTKKSLILGISAPLIELLSIEELKFVVGHEIGHYIFSHHLYPQAKDAVSEIERLNILALNRASEITSDRVGFVSGCSQDDAYRAIIKISTGLSDRHLRFDFNAFVKQSRAVAELGGSVQNMLRTHPSCSLRLKALLWFSMSKSYYSFLNRDQFASRMSLEQVDRKIDLEIQASNGFMLQKMNKDEQNSSVQMGALSIFANDDRLTKQEQAVLRECFGEDVAKNLTFMLQTDGKDDIYNRFLKSVSNLKYVSIEDRKYVFEKLEYFSSISSDNSDELLNKAKTLLAL